eukprot:359159-Chlamydomonas_euryale.AAC.31
MCRPGFRKLAEASIPKVADMDATQVTNLVTGLHKARVYDKALFEGVAANIGANFTKFDTEQMVAILKAFADNDHFTVTLFDDAADCITYCNHYLAPVKLPTTAIVNTLAAYAKFRHDRGDLFVTLCRWAPLVVGLGCVCAWGATGTVNVIEKLDDLRGRGRAIALESMWGMKDSGW